MLQEKKKVGISEPVTIPFLKQHRMLEKLLVYKMVFEN